MVKLNNVAKKVTTTLLQEISNDNDNDMATSQGAKDNDIGNTTGLSKHIILLREDAHTDDEIIIDKENIDKEQHPLFNMEVEPVNSENSNDLEFIMETQFSDEEVAQINNQYHGVLERDM